MDSKRLENLKKLAQDLKEKDDARKASSEQAIENMRARDEDFKSLFLRLENTVFKPFLKDANDTLKIAGVSLEYNSNTKSTSIQDAGKTFFELSYKAKHSPNGQKLPFIYFEGKSNTGEIVIAKKKDSLPGTQMELVGNYKIEDLDAEKIEEILEAFIMSFN
jgi:hypothetical protein